MEMCLADDGNSDHMQAVAGRLLAAGARDQALRLDLHAAMGAPMSQGALMRQIQEAGAARVEKSLGEGLSLTTRTLEGRQSFL